MEVGEHAAEPTLVDVGHAGLLGVGLNRVLRLALGADKENVSAIGGQITYVGVRVFETVERLIEINDVDAFALTVDESLHLRVPTTGLMSEVDARVEQLLHRDNCHGYTFLRFRWTDAQAHFSDRRRASGFYATVWPRLSGRLCPSVTIAGDASKTCLTQQDELEPRTAETTLLDRGRSHFVWR